LREASREEEAIEHKKTADALPWISHKTT